jgi:hypothetical protein
MSNNTYYFKKAFTNNAFYITISDDLKINELRNFLTPYVNNYMNLFYFEIVEAGTPLSENNFPINEYDTTLFCQKYNNIKNAFYIR